MRTAAPSLMTTLAIVLIASSSANGEIAWQQNLRTAHATAQKEGKLLLLHFYSDNCTWCERLEQGSFKAPQVGEAIAKSFVPVKIHANKSPKLAELFKVNRFPTDVIVTTEGQTLAHAVSPQDPKRYVAMLVGTLPGLPAAKPAAQIAANTPPAAANPPVASATAGDVPGYASAPAPQIQPPSEANTTPEPTLPNANARPQDRGLRTGPTAQLAGSRGDGLTLEMPGQITTAPVQTPEIAVPEVKASDITMPADSPPEIALQSTTIESPASSSNVAIAAPTINPEPQPVAAEQPELAMQGFCPVTVINEDRWIEGNPNFGVIHLGKLYLFTNEQNMKTFLADPVPYTPVLNEIDVVRFFEERRIVPGKREWGLKDPIYNRMFFFADEAAMDHFYNEYERYTDAAIEVMDKAVKEANPGA